MGLVIVVLRMISSCCCCFSCSCSCSSSPETQQASGFPSLHDTHEYFADHSVLIAKSHHNAFYLRRPAVHHVTSLHHVTLRRYMEKCRDRTMPMNILEDVCQKSQIRIVKTIRTPFLHGKFGDQLFHLSTHVVVIVRAPWMIFRSQYRLGWLKPSEVPDGQQFGAFYADRICSDMVLTMTHATNSLQKVHIIKYENLVSQTEEEVSRVLDFLEVTVSDKLKAEMVSKRKNPINLSKGELHDIDPEDAFHVVSSVPSCQRVMRMHNYLKFESGLTSASP
jgi:hypothetical protein